MCRRSRKAGGRLAVAFPGPRLRLVYLDDPTRREVDQDFGSPGDRVNFADGYPLLLTSTGSLEALGRWLTEDGHDPVPMNRFRPNVVVAGAPRGRGPLARIRIGSVSSGWPSRAAAARSPRSIR